MLWFSATRLLKQEPHEVDAEHGVAYWFTEPYGWVVQVGKRQVINTPLIKALVEAPFAMASKYHPPEQVGQPARVLIDITMVTGYEAEARKYAVEWIKTHKTDFEAFAVVFPPDQRMVLAAGKVAGASLRLVGMTFHAETSLYAGMSRWSPTALEHNSLGSSGLASRLSAR